MKPPETMCVVEIGLADLLMPADKGLQLVKLLQSCAALGDYRFDGHHRVWRPTPFSKLSLTVLQPHEIELNSPPPKRPGQRPGPLLLKGD